MKKLTRKLFVSVLSLAFAVVALGATTFAWFTIGGTVTASAFEAEVTAGDGIEVSIDGTNYYNALPTDVIIAYFQSEMSLNGQGQNTFANAFRFTNNTSPDGVNIYKGNAANTLAGAFTDGYLEFNLYFRSPVENTKVYLVDQKDTSAVTSVAASTFTDGTYVISDQVTWTSDATVAEYSITSGEAYQFYASNAVRISFTNDDTLAVTKIYAPEYQGTSRGSASAAYCTVTTAIEGVHAQGTVLTLAQFKALTAAQQANCTVLNANTLASSYANIKGFSILNTTLPAAAAAVTNATAQATVFNQTALATGSGVEIATLDNPVQNGLFGSVVTVRIWLEGWDSDCINPILNSNIAIGMEFTSEAPDRVA